MKLYHHHDPARGGLWSLELDGRLLLVGSDRATSGGFLAALLQWPDPIAVLRQAAEAAPPSPLTAAFTAQPPVPAPGTQHLLAPIDCQEVWAAGVTYLRSKVARMEESEGAARFYDLVYDAERPELFFKATPSRVVGSGGTVRIREDARWNVPEPEIALLLTPELRILGYTIGNDMSSRDIEGENPLYLPQAKVYAEACGLGPAILLDESPGEHRELPIRLEIFRDGDAAFAGDTSSGQMKRTFAELAGWLGRDNLFPQGAFLLTGTGLVPGDEFTLEPGDEIRITVAGIGTLVNTVRRGIGK